MGSACCVARKNDTLTSRTSGETLHRNAIYSPSWSFRWENRRRVAGEIENMSYRLSPGFSGDSSMEIKGELVLERGNLSSGRSPLGNLRTSTSPKSPIHEGLTGNHLAPSDIPIEGHENVEEKSFKESLGGVDPSEPKFPISLPSSSSSITPVAEPFTSQNNSTPASSTHPRRAPHSPGRQLWRQTSDSCIVGMKSPNGNLASEGRPSFVLSTCNSDLMGGSQGGSSDGWSMRTFSELVASSRRERWSFDGECLGSSHGRISESSSTLSRSPSIDLRTCGICSKLLTEKSSWSSQKIIASTNLSVVAVLACGHVYHAECLEAITQEGDQCDPSCPICLIGQKQLLKMARKILRAEADLKSRSSKISRNRVRDSFDPGFDVLDRRKTAEGKFPTLEASSSARRSFARPFLRRHFSFGSKWSRSLSENNSARKGFWSRFHKD